MLFCCCFLYFCTWKTSCVCINMRFIHTHTHTHTQMHMITVYNKIKYPLMHSVSWTHFVYDTECINWCFISLLSVIICRYEYRYWWCIMITARGDVPQPSAEVTESSFVLWLYLHTAVCSWVSPEKISFSFMRLTSRLGRRTTALSMICSGL